RRAQFHEAAERVRDRGAHDRRTPKQMEVGGQDRRVEESLTPGTRASQRAGFRRKPTATIRTLRQCLRARMRAYQGFSVEKIMRALLLTSIISLFLVPIATAQPPRATPSSQQTTAQPQASPAGAPNTARVPVPEPSEKALSYYHGNIVLWV